MDDRRKAYIDAIEDNPKGVLYERGPLEVISIGNADDSNIRLDGTHNIKARLYGNNLMVIDGEAIVDGKTVSEGTICIDTGDTILIDDALLTIKTNAIEICGDGIVVTGMKRFLSIPSQMDMAAFPAFRRPPRIVNRIVEEDIEIAAPPQKESAPKGQLVKTIIPPLVMAVLTVAMSMFSDGGIYMVVMAAGMAVTVVFSVTSYFSDKKERIQKEKLRTNRYRTYLLEKRKEIYFKEQKEAYARKYMNPSIYDIERMVETYSSRLYERTPFDDDFLCLSLGVSDIVPSYSAALKDDDLMRENDELFDGAKSVRDGFALLKDMPTGMRLRYAHIGLVGESEDIHNTIKSIIAQLSFLHSYEDIQIIMVTGAENADKFEYARWLPHMKLRVVNVTGLVYDENTRDQVIGSLEQILKDRETKNDEGTKNSIYLPHYILIIDEPKLISGHSIEEHIAGRGSALGLSIIWTTNMRESLPENIGTVVMLNGGERATLVLNEYTPCHTDIKLYDISRTDFAMMARRLTAVVHDKGHSSKIPKQVSFFDMLGVQNPEEISVEALWQRADSSKSLAVPLGQRAESDTVYLNLHERAHGPHGLVAGTTGSGKSEVLQSYILSLACFFSPHEVGFLLIDYKGGGMANLFKSLPHLMGTITNLDGNESMRALLSIKSELKRRQSVFADIGVNNINLYTKAYKRGEASLPLPHLFIISDEFAELKKEQPDFMSELVSTARIGRTLGVHLILATQKPSGVVDDQIWSNSRFKIALKVQNTSDSNEVLHTPDAASITEPGRCYLQIGNNEIYELFQSAFSGAAYTEEEAESGFDDRIYRINELGQGELINDDLSMTVAEESKATQLDVTVEYIKKVFDDSDLQMVEKPWLPPLGDMIEMVHHKCAADGSGGDAPSCNLAVSIGVVDLPDMQRQDEYIHDFGKDGNFAIFGSSGFGKSTTLTEIAVALAEQNSPANVNIYVLDFGNAALIPLGKLSHVADYMTYDSEEKLAKFMRVITYEMDSRRELFAREAAQSFSMYNEIADEKLPAIFVMVDNFDVLRDIELETDEFFVKLTRDGPGVGVYMVCGASTSNSIRYNIMAGFKNKVSFYQYEDGELSTIVGRSQYNLPEVKGRAMVTHEGVNVMQCYMPISAETDREYVKRLGELIADISGRYEQVAISAVAMLPEEVMLEDLKLDESPKGMIPVGLDAETVNVRYLDMSEGLHLIVGKPRSGKSNVLKLILSGIREGHVFICDNISMNLRECARGDDSTYIYDDSDTEGFFAKLEQAVEEREQSFQESDGGMLPREYYLTLEPISLVIDEGDNFVSLFENQDDEMADLIKRFIITGGSAFVSIGAKGLDGYGTLASLFKDTAQRGIVLGDPDDQYIFSVPSMRVKAEISIGYIYDGVELTKIKMPLIG
jgi:S-DNA-T family DNA segregation ATPase FtsK/SpoIIIE